MSSTNFYDLFHLNSKISRSVINKNNITYIEIIRELEEILPNNKINILDYGCGVGSLSLYLSSLGHNVIGTDISEKSINIANKSKVYFNKKIQKVKFLTLKDFFKLKNIKFDFILCIEVIEHVGNDLKLLKQFHKLLTNNGYVFLTTPSLNAPLYRLGLLKKFDAQVGHLRRYNKGMLLKIFYNSGFKIIKLYKKEGVMRNYLFTNSKFGILLKLINKLISVPFTFIDKLSIPIFGESNLHILAQKISK